MWKFACLLLVAYVAVAAEGKGHPNQKPQAGNAKSRASDDGLLLPQLGKGKSAAFWASLLGPQEVQTSDVEAVQHRDARALPEFVQEMALKAIMMMPDSAKDTLLAKAVKLALPERFETMGEKALLALPQFMKDKIVEEAIALLLSIDVPLVPVVGKKREVRSVKTWARDTVFVAAVRKLIPGTKLDNLGEKAFMALPDSVKDKIMEVALDMVLPSWLGKREVRGIKDWARDKVLLAAVRKLIPGTKLDNLGEKAFMALPDSIKDKIMEEALKMVLPDWMGKREARGIKDWARDKVLVAAVRKLIPGTKLDTLGEKAFMALPDSIKDKIVEEALKMVLPDWMGKKRSALAA